MQIEAFEAKAKIERIHYKVPANFELYIKRDDAIDPLISGNKWWKLKHAVLDARAKNKTLLVTFVAANEGETFHTEFCSCSREGDEVIGISTAEAY